MNGFIVYCFCPLQVAVYDLTNRSTSIFVKENSRKTEESRQNKNCIYFVSYQETQVFHWVFSLLEGLLRVFSTVLTSPLDHSLREQLMRPSCLNNGKIEQSYDDTSRRHYVSVTCNFHVERGTYFSLFGTIERIDDR